MPLYTHSFYRWGQHLGAVVVGSRRLCRRRGRLASKRPIHGWPRYREHLGENADRIVVGVVHEAQLLLLAIRKLGLLDRTSTRLNFSHKCASRMPTRA